MLTAWSIWRERNRRVFDNVYKPIQMVVDQIKADANFWAVASQSRFMLPTQ
jgi:hypothetical protein